MSDDESQHDLPTEGGEIFATNGPETGEDDQTGSTFMASGRNNAYTHSLARKNNNYTKNLERIILKMGSAAPVVLFLVLQPTTAAGQPLAGSFVCASAIPVLDGLLPSLRRAPRELQRVS